MSEYYETLPVDFQARIPKTHSKLFEYIELYKSIQINDEMEAWQKRDKCFMINVLKESFTNHFFINCRFCYLKHLTA